MEFGGARNHSLGINLTPMIDVLFLLIIFFMLTTSYIRTESLEVSLPGDGQAAVVSGESPLVVVLADQGRVYFGKERMDNAKVVDALNAQLAGQGATKKILLVSTNKVTVQEMVAMMDRIRSAGGRNISVSHWEY